MKTDISELRSQIIEEARAKLPKPPGEDEITAAMLGKELGCSASKASYLLEGMVAEGKATVRTNGLRKSYVYKYK